MRKLSGKFGVIKEMTEEQIQRWSQSVSKKACVREVARLTAIIVGVVFLLMRMSYLLP